MNIDKAIQHGSDALEARIPNVNAVTRAFVIEPREYSPEIVVTLPKILGAWMKERSLTNVVVNEYGFRSHYRLDNNGWAKECFR